MDWKNNDFPFTFYLFPCFFIREFMSEKASLIGVKNNMTFFWGEGYKNETLCTNEHRKSEICCQLLPR